MTEKELFQEMLKRMSADKELSAILKKMKAGTADFEDMQRYSFRTAEIRAEVLKENLSPAGNGQNEEACIQILKEQHEDVFQKESAVQKALDQKQNIHISPKKPKFPAERVRKAAHSLEDETVPFETIQRRAESAVANIANSFHDDYIKENAEFRQNAGLKCHVTRIGASKCCSWCAEVAGRYEVGKEPADFWRRHDHCSCRMDYENQKSHQRLSGTGKGWKVNSEFQRRQAQRIQYKPTRFTKEQAKAIESEKLSRYRGLTNQTLHDIIKDKESGIFVKTKLFDGELKQFAITDERINNVTDLQLSTLSKSDNDKLTEKCKELLKIMKDKPLGTEGAVIMNMHFDNEHWEISKIANSHVRIAGLNEACIVVHNHPGGTLLSESDILSFLEHENTKILGAVGNNGSTYFVEKTKDFDELGIWDYFDEVRREHSIDMSPEEHIKFIEELMEGAEEYGIKFYTRQN